MSRVFHNIKVGLDDELSEQLQWLAPNYSSYRVVRQSVDARQRHSPHFVYSVEVFDQGEIPTRTEFKIEKSNYKGPEPLIIGAGPAGLFAALRLVERGIKCHLFERGGDAVERIKGINKFWRYGVMDERNNVCYGEGGAGLYSDGKLITRIKSEHIPYVMNRLVQFGAPEEIEYVSNPHVGSDRIRRVIPKMREFLIQNGCTIHFNTKISELIVAKHRLSTKPGDQGPTFEIEGVVTERGERFMSDKVILATGHSAEDVFTMLEKNDVYIEGKSFALGLRIEHPQEQINKIQYREHFAHPKLGAANYKFAHHDKQTDIGVYSFCMCPGGYVLSSGTEQKTVVCNGMSNYKRNSPFANAAIVVTVDHEKSFGRTDANGTRIKADKWGGLNFRKQTEERAFQMVQEAGGTKEIPAQRLVDFLKRKTGPALASSSPSHVKATPLHELLPETMNKSLAAGLEKFSDWMQGFISDSAQLHGVESRTSCPVRVTRNAETLQSISHKGLFPCGEGAGYAGGITSAACDGIKIADLICES
jgi:uncharacterized protein